jgi:hypothetical protein
MSRRPSASLWRIVAGPCAGVVFAAVLMIGTNVLLVNITPATSTLFIAVTLACAAIYHFAGGYVCAAIAHDAVPATAGLIVLGTGLLMTSVVQTWSRMPAWYSVAVVVMVPAALWLGARVHAKRPGV